MNQDIFRLSQALSQQYRIRNRAIAKAESDRTMRQAHDAKIIGFDRATGQPLVEANGGIVKAESLTDGLVVGQVVSYFLPRGSAVGYIDQKISG